MRYENFIKSFIETQKTLAEIHSGYITFLKNDNPDIPLNAPIEITEYFENCINSGYIHHDDAEEFRNETSYLNMIKYFEAGNNDKTIYYRKKSGNLYTWAKMKIFPSNEYTDDEPVFFAITEDINMKIIEFFSKDEKNKFLNNFCPAERKNLIKVNTFGNFEVYDSSGTLIHFKKKKSKQLFAYLVDNYGYPVTTADIVTDILEKPFNDINAIKYVSTLIRSAIKTLEESGYKNVIIKEWNSVRINPKMIDCDYYHLIEGDLSYCRLYHNEYMKEYSWAEETNAEIQQYSCMNSCNFSSK
ncbi:MAG: hypothetical protein ACI4JM_11025 [Oscillospiraceae bacterium]